MRTGSCKVCKKCKDGICISTGKRINSLEHKDCFVPDFGDQNWK